MIAKAVGLDDQSQVRPEEIDFVVVDHRFGDQLGNPSRAGDWAEEHLEVRVGEVERVAINEVPQRANASLSGEVLERRAQGLRIDQVVLVGLVYGPLEGERLEFGG